MGKAADLVRQRSLPERYVCQACGAKLQVVVNFHGKIVWTIDPDNPDFSEVQPEFRGQTRNIRVLCSADVLHSCGYVCEEGVLQPVNKRK